MYKTLPVTLRYYSYVHIIHFQQNGNRSPLTSIPSHGKDLTAPALPSLFLTTHSILRDHSDGVGGEWLQTRHWVVYHGILFDIRPAVVLSEGLVVLGVEYVVSRSRLSQWSRVSPNAQWWCYLVFSQLQLANSYNHSVELYNYRTYIHTFQIWASECTHMHTHTHTHTHSSISNME